jgi:hypothetical protein
MHVRSTGTDAELHVTIDPRYIAQPDMSAVLANALLQRAFPTCWEAPARTRFTASQRSPSFLSFREEPTWFEGERGAQMLQFGNRRRGSHRLAVPAVHPCGLRCDGRARSMAPD